MTNSQNGWPVDATGALQDRSAVAGVTFPNGVRKGDVATVLHYVAQRFNNEVERLDSGACWGWFDRPVRGSSSISNHASGTAIDFNAPKHPLGSVGTFSAAQRTAIARILDDCDGVVRWGGNYSGRKDEMHFEIIGNAAQVKALASKINNPTEDDDVSRVDAKLGVYDALKEAATTTDADPDNGDTATGRQMRDNFNKLIDARLNVAIKPLNDKLDRIIAALPGAAD